MTLMVATVVPSDADAIVNNTSLDLTLFSGRSLVTNGSFELRRPSGANAIFSINSDTPVLTGWTTATKPSGNQILDCLDYQAGDTNV